MKLGLEAKAQRIGLRQVLRRRAILMRELQLRLPDSVKVTEERDAVVVHASPAQLTAIDPLLRADLPLLLRGQS